MATILGAVRQLVHDASTAFIDNQITQKMSDLATSTLKAGFDIVDDALAIVQDLTKEPSQEKNP